MPLLFRSTQIASTPGRFPDLLCLEWQSRSPYTLTTPGKGVKGEGIRAATSCWPPRCILPIWGWDGLFNPLIELKVYLESYLEFEPNISVALSLTLMLLTCQSSSPAASGDLAVIYIHTQHTTSGGFSSPSSYE